MRNDGISQEMVSLFIWVHHNYSIAVKSNPSYFYQTPFLIPPPLQIGYFKGTLKDAGQNCNQQD